MGAKAIFLLIVLSIAARSEPEGSLEFPFQRGFETQGADPSLLLLDAPNILGKKPVEPSPETTTDPDESLSDNTSPEPLLNPVPQEQMVEAPPQDAAPEPLLNPVPQEQITEEPTPDTTPPTQLADEPVQNSAPTEAMVPVLTNPNPRDLLLPERPIVNPNQVVENSPPPQAPAALLPPVRNTEPNPPTNNPRISLEPKMAGAGSSLFPQLNAGPKAASPETSQTEPNSQPEPPVSPAQAKEENTAAPQVAANDKDQEKKTNKADALVIPPNTNDEVSRNAFNEPVEPRGKTLSEPSKVSTLPIGSKGEIYQPLPLNLQPEQKKKTVPVEFPDTRSQPRKVTAENETNTEQESETPKQEALEYQGPEIAIIFSKGRFRPDRFRIPANKKVRLLFATTQKRPAALIIEKLKVQRWIAKEEQEKKKHPIFRHSGEITREISAQKVTEILVNPETGTYKFHDALSGAMGEFIVE